jgi:hypothetical protein
MYFSQLKVSDKGLPQFFGQKERTPSIGTDTNEPAREGHRLEGRGSGTLIVIEEKGLYWLIFIVQIHYVMVLESKKETPGEMLLLELFHIPCTLIFHV